MVAIPLSRSLLRNSCSVLEILSAVPLPRARDCDLRSFASDGETGGRGCSKIPSMRITPSMKGVELARSMDVVEARADAACWVYPAHGRRLGTAIGAGKTLRAARSST